MIIKYNIKDYMTYNQDNINNAKSNKWFDVMKYMYGNCVWDIVVSNLKIKHRGNIDWYKA